MASEIAQQPTQAISTPDDMETSFGQPYEAPTVNGNHVPVEDTMQQDDSNEDSVASNSQLTTTDPIVSKDETSSIPDPNPAGPTPIDDNAPGIVPIAEFVPKDASNLSHPTPPPDEPLTTGAADIDVEMANAGIEEQLLGGSEPVLAQTEQSLVRPRDEEDEGEDERAAKRSKVEEEPGPEPQLKIPTSETVLPDAPVGDDVVEPQAVDVAETVVEPIVDAVAEPVVESAVESVEDSAAEPLVESDAKDVKVEATQVEAQPPDAPDVPVESVSAVVAETPLDEKPAETQASTEAQSQVEAPAAPAAPSEAPKYSTEPMTTAQRNSLIEKTKNLKKTKNSSAFLKPVDHVALNIPSYPELVKNPMDLGTMETKLKEGKYGSVQDFADDFDLIIGNARRFNGDAHPVTQAGFSMEAYFRRVMEQVPSADMQAPPKVEKKRSPSITREKPRRESRMAAQSTASAAAPAPVQAPAEPPFALQSDGTPQIRRQSTMNRPARVIKPPQNREIPYAKPKRKEHQLELRFCDHVLDEIRSQKYHQWNSVFMHPVDPVALNIPHYRQVIKTPMDLSTMQAKLKSGQYGTAGEFKKDFDLIVKNCLTFNPVGNPVRDLGIQFQREFEALWAEKDKWERKNAPASNRASSASADDDSAADEEDDEDDEPEDDKEATIQALQKQLLAMQNALSGLGGGKPAKTKKAKAGKDSKKKVGTLSSAPPKSKPAPKPAAKAKKPKQVTYEEKQEISEAVAKMDEKQVGRLTEIITQNCAKYRDMEEMELEIDDLPNDVQVMLLDYVRRIFGNPNRKKAREPSPDDAAALDDDDYEERGGGRGGKRKKHKPMGKKEQQETIDSIKDRLAAFSQAATSRSESPTNPSFNAAGTQAETSGDEESEESEEE